MPKKYVDFGEGSVCRLKIHEWALKKTCNLIAFPSPLVPLWRKAKFSCWKIVHLILCELFMALGRGSGPKKMQFLSSCSSPRSFPKLLCHRDPGLGFFGFFWSSCGNAAWLGWSQQAEWERDHFGFWRKKKNNKTNQSSHRMINSGGKALGERERSWERGAAFAAFSPLQFSGHLREFFSLCQLFWDHIPARACLGSAGPWGHSGAALGSSSPFIWNLA